MKEEIQFSLDINSPVILPASIDSWVEKDYGLYKTSRPTSDISQLMSAKAFACDIETTSLVPSQGKIRLIQIYLQTSRTVFILDLWDPNLYTKVWLDSLLIKLADPETIKIWHNGLFDIGWLFHHYGVMSVNNFDSMIASQLIKAGKFWGYQTYLKASPNSLGFVCEENGFPHDKEQQRSDWSVPALTQEQIDYAARDPYFTYQVAKRYKDFLYKFCPDVVKAEMGCLSSFAYMSAVGLPCDVETLDARIAEYSAKTSELEDQLKSVIRLNPDSNRTWFETYYSKKGLPKKFNTPGALDNECNSTLFNPGSSQSVGRWLASLVPIDTLIKTDNKTGKSTISTGKATLFQLYTDLKKPELLDLIAFRSIKGAASKFSSYRNSYNEDTRSIACSYTVLATQGSGRSSSGKKAAKGEIKYHNGQNFSKHLNTHRSHGLASTRSIIQASPGYSLVEIDAAASHMQFARHLSQDKSLIESNNTGLKIHYYTLAGILKQARNMDVTPQEVEQLVLGLADKKNHGDYKNLYRLSKTVIYAYLNKAGAATLQGTFFNLEVAISREECRLYLDSCAEQYSRLTEFQFNKFNTVKKTLQPHYHNGRYIGHFAYSQHMDGAVTYHQAKRKPTEIKDSEDDVEIEDETEYIPANHELYLKISDVVSSCWLRPEATIMKKSLGEVFQFQIDSQLPFKLRNFSHDSYMLEVRNDVLSEVVPYCYNVLNNNFISYIPDYKPEGTWEDCVLGQYWEKP
jgi:DNA polymerase I-like protein with 3'-5' exonuclease and polymerase domains